MSHKTPSQGIAHLGLILAIVVVVAAVAFGGWYVWQKNRDDKPTNNVSQNEQKDAGKDPQAIDPYAGWQSYSNAKYDISFKYPPDWRVEEVPGPESSPSASLTQLEFAINVKRNEEAKYNTVVVIEVDKQAMDKVEAVYDKIYAQSSSATVSKSSDKLKGESSVQYVVNNVHEDSKRYLFSKGGKTYSFASINEELNVQLDPDYWAKFDRVFESFQP